MSDQAISSAIGEFIKQQRLNKNKSQQEVAAAANISRSTLSLLERGQTVTLSTFIQVLRVLDLLYILENFQVTNPISPIALAKMEREKRKRASKKIPKSDW